MDGIVLLAKQPGVTSFTSLHQVKRAIKSTKVGHTGTLDSFAQGLLVVCTGRLTRLAGDITEFDKTYKAVIKFGEETDTLDYEGNVIKTAPLPEKDILIETINSFVGIQMQKPPRFSAIHVDGKRASDLARMGIKTEISARQITVYSAQIEDFLLDSNGKVQACLVCFSVSKGTYIRSLARDIAEKCGSAGYLIGLYRTKVGNFKIEDSACFKDLPDFSIAQSLKFADEYKPKTEHEKPVIDYEKDEIIYKDILSKMQSVSEDIAKQCGFNIIHLATSEGYIDFQNGRPLKNRLFVENLYDIQNNTMNAVFSNNGEFAGLISKDNVGKIRYKFVIN